MSQREAKEHPLSFLVVRGLSGVVIVANSLNHPICQSSSGGMRRGITVAIVGSGIGFLLAFTCLTTYSARTDGSSVPKSTIGKTGEMKSPAGSAYINETQNWNDSSAVVEIAQFILIAKGITSGG